MPGHDWAVAVVVLLMGNGISLLIALKLSPLPLQLLNLPQVELSLVL